MEFIFGKEDITYGTNNLKYSIFETVDANKELIKLLIVCIKEEKNDIKFICTEDCSAFGKLIKETLENEFNIKSKEEI